MLRGITASLIVVSIGCLGGKSTSSPTVVREQPAPTRVLAPPTVQALARATERFAESRQDAQHSRLAAALMRLADVVRETDPPAARRIDDRATQVLRAPPHERLDADLFLAPFDVALDSLSASVGNDAQRNAYVRARRAEHAFVTDKPLQHQRPEIADALRALTNLAARLHGASPLFDVAPHNFAYAPETFAERARTAGRRVGELGRERDWDAAGTAAKRALDAFADALEVAPVSLPPARWSAAVTKLRYAALELEHEGEISVQRSAHIKAGLLAAIAGIEQLADPRPRMYEISINAARAAAKAIDPRTSFVFQRGVIQEAFRATANAYLSISLAPRSREELSRRSR